MIIMSFQRFQNVYVPDANLARGFGLVPTVSNFWIKNTALKCFSY